MVGTLQPKAACGASEIPDRYEQMRHPNGNLRSPQHAHTNSMQIPKRARCRETLSDLVGRVFSLDIAFYRTCPHKPEKKASLAAGLEVKQFGMQLEEQVQTELDAATAYTVLEGVNFTLSGAVGEIICESRHRESDVINESVGHTAVLAIEDVEHCHSELNGHAFAYLRILEEAHIDVVHRLSAHTRVAGRPNERVAKELGSVQVVVDPPYIVCRNSRASCRANNARARSERC